MSLSAERLADLVESGAISVEEAIDIAAAGTLQISARTEVVEDATPTTDALTVAEAVELYPVAEGSKYFPKYPGKIPSQAQSKMVFAITDRKTWLQKAQYGLNRLQAGSIINALQDGTSVALADGTILVPDPQ